MLNRRSKSLLQVANIESVTSRHECIARGYSHRDRIHTFNNGGRGHRLRLNTLRQSRGCLTFRQTVDSVIVKDVCKVQIPPTRVDKVSSTYAQPVSITANRDNGQSRISQTGTSGDWEYSAMEGMESVGVYKVWSLTRASDSREDCDPMGF